MAYDPSMPGAESPLAAALERVGDRWSLLLIEALLEGPRRFNELQAGVAGIAPNILSDRLKRLESERVIRSPPYSERPVRLAYELTAEGPELEAALPGKTRFGVMQHLRVLEAASLVTTRRAGRRKLHYLNPVPIRLIHDRWISKYAEPWVGGMTALKKQLEAATVNAPMHVY